MFISLEHKNLVSQKAPPSNSSIPSVEWDVQWARMEINSHDKQNPGFFCDRTINSPFRAPLRTGFYLEFKIVANSEHAQYKTSL